jgi:hypothetical protein
VQYSRRIALIIAASLLTGACELGLETGPAPEITVAVPATSTHAVATTSQPGINTASPPAPARTQASPATPLAATTPSPERAVATRVFEFVTPQAPGTPAAGEVSAEILDRIVADLTDRTGAARAAVSLLRAEQVVWNDGSLGCPQPGMMYTQALVSGYWVVLETGGREYDYRATEGGYFMVCETGLPARATPGLPES